MYLSHLPLAHFGPLSAVILSTQYIYIKALFLLPMRLKILHGTLQIVFIRSRTGISCCPHQAQTGATGSLGTPDYSQEFRPESSP